MVSFNIEVQITVDDFFYGITVYLCFFKCTNKDIIIIIVVLHRT